MEPSTPPFVSIIVATFNRTEFLERCIKGLVSNDYDRYEIIVVDQGRDDKTKRLISERFAGNGKIRYIHTDTVGLSHARNLGCKSAKGEIVAFIDDDAVPAKGWIRAYAKVFSDIKPAPAMAGGKIMPEWETTLPDWYPEERQYLLGLYDIGDKTMPFPEADLPIGANFAMLKCVAERLGGFDDRVGFNSERKNPMIAGEDSLMGLRVREAQYSIYYQPKAVVSHHISARKLSRGYFLKRHFWEGATHIVLEACRKPLPKRWAWGAFVWHSKNIFGQCLYLTRWLFFGSERSKKRMLCLSKACYSAGICVKSLEALLSR